MPGTLPEHLAAAHTFKPLPRAGLHSLLDALLTVPSGFVNARRATNDLGEMRKTLAEGHRLVLGELTVVAISGIDRSGNVVPQSSIFTRKTARLEIECRDANNHPCIVSCFGNIWEWRGAHIGRREPLLIKSVKLLGTKLYVDATRLSNASHIARGIVAPLYSGLPGAASAQSVTACINYAVNAALRDPDLWLHARDRILAEAQCGEAELLATADIGCGDIAQLLCDMHRPATVAAGNTACQAAIKLAAAAVSHSARAAFGGRLATGAAAIQGAAEAAESIVRTLAGRGIQLTGSQRTCIDALIRSLSSPRPSATLLNGDVGTGKTLTFLIPAIAAHMCGKKVAIMAPNTILADQLAGEARKFFPDVEIARVATGRKLKSTHAVLVGTSGMATVCKLAKWTPDLLVIDEQHKLATVTRDALVAQHTHVIEASATPVPRSLAIALYGGMDQLLLTDCPVVKQVHSVALFGSEARRQVSLVAQHAVQEGGVAAFIYPVVQPSADADDDAADSGPVSRPMASLLTAYDRLSAMWPGQVARLYGEMPDDEKTAELDALRAGSKRYVVASSVLEVGIDIPTLKFMVVNDADRFGMSQLHQLRGRLARAGGTGYFMMFVERAYDEVSPRTVDRLEAVAKIKDGFELAEADLYHRGFGDVSGERQSGERGNRVLRGIALAPRDFLALKIRGAGGRAIPMAEAPAPDEEETEEFGQSPR